MITLRGVPLRVELSFEYLGSGRSRGAFRGARPPPPPLILDQTEARRAEKMFFGDRLPPPPYLRVWIRRCYLAIFYRFRSQKRKKVVRLVRDYKSYPCLRLGNCIPGTCGSLTQYENNAIIDHNILLNKLYLYDSYERLSVNIDQNRLFVAQVQNSNFAHFWLIDNP